MTRGGTRCADLAPRWGVSTGCPRGSRSARKMLAARGLCPPAYRSAVRAPASKTAPESLSRRAVSLRIVSAHSRNTSSVRRSLRLCRGNPAALSSALSHLPSLDGALAGRSCPMRPNPVRHGLVRRAVAQQGSAIDPVDRLGVRVPVGPARRGQKSDEIQTDRRRIPRPPRLGSCAWRARMLRNRGTPACGHNAHLAAGLHIEKARPSRDGLSIVHPAPDSSGESDLHGGARAHRFCRARHVTMRHLTTSFPLLNVEQEVGRSTGGFKPAR